MSILSASMGISRYRVMEPVNNEVLGEIPQRLKEFSFRDIDDTTDERSFGWTNIDDFLDVSWTKSPPEKGQYLTFSLRLETRRVSPAVFKKHFQIALNKEMAQNKEAGKEFISRARKQEIREQVMLKLRARALPIPTTFDVAWDTNSGRVILDTTNTKAKALFEDHFQASFDLHLEPLTPFYLALNMLGEEAASTLENLEPTQFA